MAAISEFFEIGIIGSDYRRRASAAEKPVHLPGRLQAHCTAEKEDAGPGQVVCSTHRFDATLKDIVAEHPADFADLCGWPKNERATPLNVDLSTVSAATDVALGFGDPIRKIVDLNFQSGPDAGLSGRLLLYHAALHSRFGVAVRKFVMQTWSNLSTGSA